MFEDTFGLNNFKGVMLCARPDENINVDKDRPFCSMVKYDIPLGYNKPKINSKMEKNSKNYNQQRNKFNQKRWLINYSNNIKLKEKENEINEMKLKLIETKNNLKYKNINSIVKNRLASESKHATKKLQNLNNRELSVIVKDRELKSLLIKLKGNITKNKLETKKYTQSNCTNHNFEVPSVTRNVVIINNSKKEKPIDVNNLPYLYESPFI